MKPIRAMSQHELGAHVTSQVDGPGRLRLQLEADGNRAETYFESTDARLTPSHEALVAAAFLPAMRLGLDLVVDGALSGRFLAGLDILGDIYRTWWPGDLSKIAVRSAAPVTRSRAMQGRVGLFFTAGVDSFYTFLKHQDEITDLIFLSGFGREEGDAPLEARRQEMVRRAAAGLERNLIFVTTDIRAFLTGYGLHFARLAAGPALNAVGLLLEPEFSRIYMAASDTYDGLTPWSSHPLTDPRWSTETLEFIHDGCEATRLEKVRRVATSAVAMQTLRVCEQLSANAPNCGRCDKCVRTKMRLAAVGALDRCTTFDNDLDASHAQYILFKDGRLLDNYLQSVSLLEAAGRHLEFATALRGAIVKWRRARHLRAFLQAWFPGPLSVRRRIRRLLARAALWKRAGPEEVASRSGGSR